VQLYLSSTFENTDAREYIVIGKGIKIVNCMINSYVNLREKCICFIFIV